MGAGLSFRVWPPGDRKSKAEGITDQWVEGARLPKLTSALDDGTGEFRRSRALDLHGTTQRIHGTDKHNEQAVAGCSVAGCPYDAPAVLGKLGRNELGMMRVELGEGPTSSMPSGGSSRLQPRSGRRLMCSPSHGLRRAARRNPTVCRDWDVSGTWKRARPARGSPGRCPRWRCPSAHPGRERAGSTKRECAGSHRNSAGSS